MGSYSTAEQQALNIRNQLFGRIKNYLQHHNQQFSKISESLKQKILKANATQLADMLDQGIVSSVQIITCFSQRTATIGVANNCVLDEMFEEALNMAKQYDKIRAENKGKVCWKIGRNQHKCLPPFYGVPISVKQSILMKGKQSYMGFVQKVNKLGTEELLFMQLVKKMGFIPFVRSNVCQGCKMPDSGNNIFGYVKNPWNKEKSPGGSSGGQSSLVASCCSPIGIGTDIAGSLRVPAEWTGLCTIMANGRLTRLGNGYNGAYPGGMSIKPVFGFLTKDPEDLITTLAYLCNESNYESIQKNFIDPYLNIKRFNKKIFQQRPKLRIGFLTDLATTKCGPAQKRSVLQCEQILERLGHHTVRINCLGKFQKLYFFMMNAFMANGDFSAIDQLRGNEKLTSEYKLLKIVLRIPWLIRRVIIWLINKRFPRMARMIKVSKPLTPSQLFQQIYTHQSVISASIYSVFVKNDIDLIIMPTTAFPAPTSQSIGGLQYCFSYTASWNVIHYPAGCIPVTLVRPNELNYDDEYKDMYTKNIQKVIEGSQGLPVGVQVVSTPFQEQKILYIMSQLSKNIRFRQKHPYPL